ncbi:MAG: TPM domain-containing protein [Bauldia sp.]|nr:TPM domain-containing protein [Bauldia sp.]
MTRLLSALLAALVVAATPALAAPAFPQLTGRVVDEANVIPADVEAGIEEKLAALEAKTTDQFVVVALASLQGYEIADFGYQLGRAWAIGQKDKDNGVILIVAPNERVVRFEVGYGLEGTLTDALTRVIIENAILPRFRADDMAGGIERGVDDAIQVLEGDAAELQQLADRRPNEEGFWTPLIPFLVFLVIVVVINTLRRRRGWRWLAGPGAGGSSWSSGGSSGGFSGGGGSFGGGGSSGRW